VFLADSDARRIATRQIKKTGTATLVYRPDAQVQIERGRAVAESTAELASLKQVILRQTGGYPYVEEDEPVVCAWYPTAGAVLLWNLAERPQTVTLNLTKINRGRQTVALPPLGTALVPE
jgi:hypothetical protein